MTEDKSIAYGFVHAGDLHDEKLSRLYWCEGLPDHVLRTECTGEGVYLERLMDIDGEWPDTPEEAFDSYLAYNPEYDARDSVYKDEEKKVWERALQRRSKKARESFKARRSQPGNLAQKAKVIKVPK
jgi:hypothetical protein